MRSNQLFMRGKIYIFVLLLILPGCVTSKKGGPPPGEAVGKKMEISGDVMAFRDLQEIDLDGDGKKEIVAVYTTSSNSTGIKVIKTNENKKGVIVFEKKFELSPDIEFKVIENTPTITVKKTDPVTKKSSKEILRWDGKAFVPAFKPPR